MKTAHAQGLVSSGSLLLQIIIDSSSIANPCISALKLLLLPCYPPAFAATLCTCMSLSPQGKGL
jgi:hypothetical protein